MSVFRRPLQWAPVVLVADFRIRIMFKEDLISLSMA